MEELSHRTGDTVILAAKNGIYSQFIHVVQARTNMRFAVPPGSRRLVVWSATGFALLSLGTDDEALALCRRTNAEALGNRELIDARKMLSNVRRTRNDGYFFSKGLVTPGAGSIAVPLPHGVDVRERPLTIALSGPLNDFMRREQEIVALLNDAVPRYLKSDLSEATRKNT
jgi:DNA-binding IclR family transcriptional regulator